MKLTNGKNSRLNFKLIAASAGRLNRRIYIYHGARMLRGLQSRVTRDHLEKIPLFIGMKVMITENISVPFKVVNGSEGMIQGIRFKVEEGRR
jgi:ATP-dependent DNA helicase PIF1